MFLAVARSGGSGGHSPRPLVVIRTQPNLPPGSPHSSPTGPSQSSHWEGVGRPLRPSSHPAQAPALWGCSGAQSSGPSPSWPCSGSFGPLPPRCPLSRLRTGTASLMVISGPPGPATALDTCWASRALLRAGRVGVRRGPSPPAWPLLPPPPLLSGRSSGARPCGEPGAGGEAVGALLSLCLDPPAV